MWGDMVIVGKCGEMCTCESHESSAPRSIIPCCISRIMGVLFFSLSAPEYTIACCSSTEHEQKPYSMPPRVSDSGSLFFICFGRVRKEMPR